MKNTLQRLSALFIFTVFISLAAGYQTANAQLNPCEYRVNTTYDVGGCEQTVSIVPNFWPSGGAPYSVPPINAVPGPNPNQQYTVFYPLNQPILDFYGISVAGDGHLIFPGQARIVSLGDGCCASVSLNVTYIPCRIDIYVYIYNC